MIVSVLTPMFAWFRPCRARMCKLRLCLLIRMLEMMAIGHARIFLQFEPDVIRVP